MPLSEPSLSMNMCAPAQNPISDLLNFSQKYDPSKIDKKEMCSTHSLRKTLVCLTCKVFICDRCLVTPSSPNTTNNAPEKGSHFNHRTGQLSKMAYDILDVFKSNFNVLTTNLDKIQSIKPQDWKLKLRA